MRILRRGLIQLIAGGRLCNVDRSDVADNADDFHPRRGVSTRIADAGADALPPGKSVRAIASLMIATPGASVVSAAVKYRPARSRVPVTSK